MAVVDEVMAGEEDVEAVRRWVRLSCTEPGTHLPALATISQQLQLPTGVVRSALECLAAEELVTLHEGYRLYSVGTMSPAERTYRIIRTAIHRSFLPGERFMNRDEIARTFQVGTKEAAAAVRRLVTEGVLVGPRGQYVNEYGPEQQRRRVKQLRERASDLRREALALMQTAREVEGEMEESDDNGGWLPSGRTTVCRPRRGPGAGGAGEG
ncbi:GntR family transcriptional regulator [Streptomyces graminilatus]|uniref:GntR family transcriptional regulator n=1 Tax=Streptomyces graminilatus TaxID=1464070 RepID=UPI0007C80A7E|nr:GntR family transcriptional regulator [Streptomyces graminilatus]